MICPNCGHCLVCGSHIDITRPYYYPPYTITFGDTQTSDSTSGTFDYISNLEDTDHKHS